MEEKENELETADTPAAEEPKSTEEKREEPLDTETTFADMNIEGLPWYDPHRKKGKREKMNISRKEYWAMVRGAFAAMLPMILCIFSAMGLVFLLAYLWLKP